ncbi:hypothetical protein K458DRAFT_391483 [Lentithecium fluviatile CBS 122367]|uniref:Uncharacterized protein n=1 Tax=Lentithecium fluviatile CBS 122367 TaxID=1168545 RepID=A0A6G1IV26_9PLEO|nr:hypothetical protein K458DRAFT_391483 [Lentithecium fluviatile CBS 122367]
MPGCICPTHNNTSWTWKSLPAGVSLGCPWIFAALLSSLAVRSNWRGADAPRASQYGRDGYSVPPGRAFPVPTHEQDTGSSDPPPQHIAMVEPLFPPLWTLPNSLVAARCTAWLLLYSCCRPRDDKMTSPGPAEGAAKATHLWRRADRCGASPITRRMPTLMAILTIARCCCSSQLGRLRDPDPLMMHSKPAACCGHPSKTSRCGALLFPPEPFLFAVQDLGNWLVGKRASPLVARGHPPSLSPSITVIIN